DEYSLWCLVGAKGLMMHLFLGFLALLNFAKQFKHRQKISLNLTVAEFIRFSYSSLLEYYIYLLLACDCRCDSLAQIAVTWKTTIESSLPFFLFSHVAVTLQYIWAFFNNDIYEPV
ncbi:hypothetical protein ACJX0J_033159, partial [Zea mays]